MQLHNLNFTPTPESYYSSSHLKLREKGYSETMWALVQTCPLDREQKEVIVVVDEFAESAWG